VSISYYMDHHVPAAVTAGLRRLGVDVLTAFEDGWAEAEDEALLARAHDLGRTVYTQDDDFLAIAHEWLIAGRESAGVVFAAQMGITVGQAIRDLELIARALDAAEMINRIEFIPY
jgi:Domain of unknown function (DUF5615)